MFRLLGQLEIYGTKASIDRCRLSAPFSNWLVMQIGLKRKIPDTDSWCYHSPWYRFRIDTLDAELRAFITAHAAVGKALSVRDSGIAHAFLTLCPVEQSEEESLAGILSCKALRELSDLGVALQIAPASLMPDAEYWKS